MSGITNDRIYTLINSTRLELKNDISDLRRQFETLEAGRLTRLEAKMNEFEISQIKKDGEIQQNTAVLGTKIIILFAIGNILLIAAAQAIFTWWFKK